MSNILYNSNEVEIMRVIITAGGTGGHIYPAIAIINKIKEMSYYKMYYRGKYIIEYLDNEITKVLKLLDAHKNKYQNYTADFTEVINNLTFEDTTGTVQ